MVLASKPVASVMRLAARPVGAHSTTSPSWDRRLMMQLMMVVLPVPGPPVITSTPVSRAEMMAWRCRGLKRISRLFSKLSMALFAPWLFTGAREAISSHRRVATSRSAESYWGR